MRWCREGEGETRDAGEKTNGEGGCGGMRVAHKESGREKKR